ncbi:MAG: adenylosuccinate synthase [Myxococcales bacterium]|jgi:adenylosuccinate synthase|nr:adenylosuccinate synthase [Myxococcales bacterium]
MPGVVIVGAQWGDEGKGKVVDIYTEHADMVVRFAGGPNAGHTLVVGADKLVVRLVPSGILRPQSTCVLGQGMVVDPATLAAELAELSRRGLLEGRELWLSDRAHLILPYHVAIDTLRERGAGAIGTTKRGVGPAYEDKAARLGIHAGALRDPARLEAAITRALARWAPVARDLGGELPSLADVMAAVAPVREALAARLTDAASLVDGALRAGKKVLFEGAQGTLLDVDHGTYPFVTSSSAIAGGACTGAGVGPTRIGCVVGLTKAYTTRVGGGPFPTELHDDVGEAIRKAGSEFGSVTGRPRRTGWLDLPALRYATVVNGFDGLALTKLDVLTGQPEVRACVAYEVDGRETRDFPLADLDRARPIYRTFPGWSEDLRGARRLEDLPARARAFVDFVSAESGCPLFVVSVGYERDDTIVLRSPFG